jgi:hypothetical protein
MSRSICRRLFSRRSRCNSSRSAVVRASAVPPAASTSAWRTHSRTAVSVRSRRLLTAPTLSPPSRQRRTTSALNSGVKWRRARRFFFDDFDPAMGHSWRIVAPVGVSTNRGEVQANSDGGLSSASRTLCLINLRFTLTVIRHVPTRPACPFPASEGVNLRGGYVITLTVIRPVPTRPACPFSASEGVNLRGGYVVQCGWNRWSPPHRALRHGTILAASGSSPHSRVSRERGSRDHPRCLRARSSTIAGSGAPSPTAEISRARFVSGPG